MAHHVSAVELIIRLVFIQWRIGNYRLIFDLGFVWEFTFGEGGETRWPVCWIVKSESSVSGSSPLAKRTRFCCWARHITVHTCSHKCEISWYMCIVREREKITGKVVVAYEKLTSNPSKVEILLFAKDTLLISE